MLLESDDTQTNVLTKTRNKPKRAETSGNQPKQSKPSRNDPPLSKKKCETIQNHPKF